MDGPVCSLVEPRVVNCWRSTSPPWSLVLTLEFRDRWMAVEVYGLEGQYWMETQVAGEPRWTEHGPFASEAMASQAARDLMRGVG